MALLTVHTVPDDVLRKLATPVDKVDARLGRFMDDMLETMYASNGIGLAANQVGVLERVITVDLSDTRDGSKALLMANPDIVWRDESETFTYKEGCLCLPDQFAEVTRPRRIRIQYLDQSGKKQELEAEDLLSQCLQHEVDHLNGKLFVDYISGLRRSMMIRKVEKAMRNRDDGDKVL